MRAYLIPLLFLLMGGLLGFFSWKNQVYVELKPSGQGRFVASDQQGELLNLSLDEYKDRSKNSLFEEAGWIVQAGSVEFVLGNFLIKNPSHQFVCQAYSYLELHFSATGISLSGDPSEMLVQAPCSLSSSGAIGPFKLPLKVFTSKEQTFDFEDQNLIVRFYNTAKSLTDSWLLTRVRFFNGEDDEDAFTVSYDPELHPTFELKVR